MSGRRVVVVTGGGGGIGAAIATELGRRGALVVTVDPLVSLDGTARLPDPEETTAGRIVAAGGAAVASPVSVTDRDAVQRLFDDLVAEHGRLDAVVNVAGITRPTSFTRGSEGDWREVIEVHLGGYLNVLGAALPIMAAAGRGRILGVTSGSGWRAADAGAYGCAKRAVAALTWQLGRVAPPGVTVNAVSPIAVTRMVTEALARAAPAGSAASGSSSASSGPSGSSSTGGLSLGAMPAPEELGPLGAHLVDDALDWLSGQVLFGAGTEVALVEPPRLLEAVSIGGPGSVAAILEAATTAVLGPAEAARASTGGANPRLAAVGSDAASPPAAAAERCLVVSDRPELGSAVATAIGARGVSTTVVAGAGIRGSTSSPAVTFGPTEATFAHAAEVLARCGEQDSPVDAVVLVPEAERVGTGPEGWERVLAEHDRVVDRLVGHAAWSRAVADATAADGRPRRLVTLVDGRPAGGRTRAQATAQLARAARKATGDGVSSFAVGIEGGADVTVAELAAHLVASPGAAALSGAELVAGPGWCGLRSHPRPSTAVTLGRPDVPGWFDDVLRAAVERS